MTLRLLNRHRAQTLMQRKGLDGLVLIQPETILYATGARPGSATAWRRAGAAFLIVPANAAEPMTAIIGDFHAREFHAASGIEDIVTFPIWVDLIDIADVPGQSLVERLATARPPQQARARPATFDRQETFALLADTLLRRGLHSAQLGTEYAFLPAADMACFAETCPDVRWQDASDLVGRLRMIKSAEEIERLTAAAIATEAGARAAIAHIRPGCTADDLLAVFRSASSLRAAELGYAAPSFPISSITIGPGATGKGRRAEKGDIVRLDLACCIDGYVSDCARTAVIGRPSANQQAIYDALRTAFDAGAVLLRPGVALGDVFRAVMSSMHGQGFDMYRRGHFGHGVGASLFVEEWPFIAADEPTEIEPGMVLAYEVPWYIRGLGAFTIEDQFTIGRETSDPCWGLSRDLLICD
ncbi:Peptidase M24 [Agrobacterium genomosp. 5 str. CFBP 6626]|nr:Peptidase M24 [Agrobacterium genomosp. 5 str. CFBP 6626]